MRKPSGSTRCRSAPVFAVRRITLPVFGGISGWTRTTANTRTSRRGRRYSAQRVAQRARDDPARRRCARRRARSARVAAATAWRRWSSRRRRARRAAVERCASRRRRRACCARASRQASAACGGVVAHARERVHERQVAARARASRAISRAWLKPRSRCRAARERQRHDDVGHARRRQRARRGSASAVAKRLGEREPPRYLSAAPGGRPGTRSATRRSHAPTRGAVRAGIAHRLPRRRRGSAQRAQAGPSAASAATQPAHSSARPLARGTARKPAAAAARRVRAARSWRPTAQQRGDRLSNLMRFRI